MSKYEFKGWDWTELAECWNLDPENKLDEDILAEEIQKYMWSKFDRKGHSEMIGDLKAFIKALSEAKGVGYWEPVFKSLLQIESNHTLIAATCSLLRNMWT